VANARRVTVEILGDAKGAKRAVSETEGALGRLSVRGRITGQGLSVIGTGLKGLGVAAAGFGIATGAAMFAAGKSVVKLGIDYQNQLNTMQAVTHATDAVMQQVAKTSRDLGNDLSLPATSAADAAQAMTELAKGNLTAQQAMQAAKGTLQLAAAAQIDGAAAATIQADALNAFGLKATSAGHVADVLANAANAATGEISDFAQGMQQSAAVAHQFGISLDDSVTALALFANRGIKGSDAGTSLKTALIAMVHPSKQAADAFKTLNVHAFDARGNFVGLSAISEQLAVAQGHMSKQAFNAAAATAFGTDAVRAAAVFADAGAAGFDKMAKAVGRQGGAAQVAQAKTKGLGGALQGLQSQLETVKIDIFTKEAPNLEKFVRALSARLPAAADAGLRGLDRLTSFVEGEIPAARAVVEKFGPAVQTWVTGKLELAAHAADVVAGPALRGVGNILDGLAPKASAAGQAIDGGLRAAIDAAGKVARQFEAESKGLGQSVGALADSVGRAAHDALPALKDGLSAATAAASVMIQTVSGAAAILAPFAGNALLAAGAIKGISLAMAGVNAARGKIGQVTSAWGAMADRASFAAGTVTQKVGTALGKDLNTAAGAGAKAMVGVRSAFTLLGGAAVGAGVAVALLGYAHEQAAQDAEHNREASKGLYDELRQGGQVAADARAKLDSLGQGVQGIIDRGGPAAAAAKKLADQIGQGKTASDAAYQSLSEQDKVGLRVTQTQNDLALAIQRYGSGSAEATAAAGLYTSAIGDQKVLQDALNTATATATLTLAGYTDKILAAAGASVQLATQELGVRQAGLSLTQAQTTAADAAAQYGKNSIQAKQASLAYQQAQTTLKGQILSTAEAAKQAAIANDKTGDAAHAAAAGAAAERTELAKLAAGLAPGSALRREIEGLIGALDRIPRAVNVNVKTTYTQQGINVGTLATGKQARAAGGPVTRGMPYIVGEKRPELFVPNADGTIVPRVPAATAATPAGGVVYNITVNVPAGAHPADVGAAAVKAIQAYEKRSGKAWRAA
jgi:TP901 family phage tail tape measure protein